MGARAVSPHEAMRADTVPEGAAGPWAIRRHVVTQEEQLAGSMSAVRSGRGSIRAGTRITMLVHERRGTVMSDTPDELRDMLPLVYALGQLRPRRVLIHGLGLGCAVRAALACPTVELVDVVELDEHVAELHGQLDPRVHLTVDDCFTTSWPAGVTWDVAWHDVWDTLGDEEHVEGMARLHRSFGRRVRWQGTWGRSWIERQRQLERRGGW